MARSLKKQVVIYGNGTYKFRRKVWKKLASYVLRNADLVTARESETFRYLRSLGKENSNIFLTADPAFLLPPASQESVQRILQTLNLERKNSDRLLVGVTLTRENMKNFADAFPHIGKKKAVQMYANLLDAIVEKYGATIVFLPHCIGHGRYKDDRFLATEIASKCRNSHRIIVITTEYSARELKGLIGSCDIMLGGRIHSIIGALSMCVPSIIIGASNDSRVSGIIGEMMNQREWIYYYNDGLADLSSKIDKLVSRRDAVSKELECQSQIVRKLAFKNGILLKAILDAKTNP